MSIKQSLKRQNEIESLKKALSAGLNSCLIADIILHEFPKWSVYYKDGDSNHSYNYDCFTNASIYKFLKESIL